MSLNWVLFSWVVYAPLVLAATVSKLWLAKNMTFLFI